MVRFVSRLTARSEVSRHLSVATITQLLFATTFLWIFCVVLGFAFNATAGNGGEYWGFNGYVEPWRAAQIAFDAGDRRFLAYELNTVFAGSERGHPNAYRCDFHVLTPEGHLRFNVIAARHGYDSIRIAHAFAHEFNYILAILIRDAEDAWCEPALTG